MMKLARSFWASKYPERELYKNSLTIAGSSPTVSFIYHGERGKTRQIVSKADILLYCLDKGILNVGENCLCIKE